MSFFERRMSARTADAIEDAKASWAAEEEAADAAYAEAREGVLRVTAKADKFDGETLECLESLRRALEWKLEVDGQILTAAHVAVKKVTDEAEASIRANYQRSIDLCDERVAKSEREFGEVIAYYASMLEVVEEPNMLLNWRGFYHVAASTAD